MCVTECLADDDVHLEHRFRVEADAFHLAVDKEFGVEALEMLGPQPAQRNRSKSGKDVLDDSPSVGIPRAWPEADLLGRKPPLQEVHSESQPGRFGGVVLLGGEGLGHVLGSVAVGAGGMPATALPAGNRVDAFVDDGVEAGSFGDDVSPHDDLPSR